MDKGTNFVSPHASPGPIVAGGFNGYKLQTCGCGQAIGTTLDQQMTAGSHKVEFTVGNLSVGIYLVRITANFSGKESKFRQKRKMILLH